MARCASGGKTAIRALSWGVHPDTKQPYKWLVWKPVVEVEAAQIVWPDCCKVKGELVTVTTCLGQPARTDSLGQAFRTVLKDSPMYLCGGSALPALPAPAAIPVGDSETPSLKPVDFDIDPETKSQIDMAVELGEKANQKNNAASFQACFALISLRDSEDLSDLSPSEREYFAKRWYSHLRNLDRINPTKPRCTITQTYSRP